MPLSMPPEPSPPDRFAMPVRQAATAQGGKTVAQALLELRAILDNATIGIMFTRSRKVVEANARLAEMLGRERDELIGLSGVEFFPSTEVYEELGKTLVPLLRERNAYRGELQIKRRDGSLFWCRVSARALDQQRPMEGTIWIMEDVSEDRLIREALEQSTRELTGIFDTALIGIAMVRDGKLVRCNHRYGELLGYEQDALVGQPADMALEDSEVERFRDLFRESIPAGIGFDDEMRLKRRDGSTFWARVAGRRLNSDDQAASSAWLFEDVTDRHNAEQALKQAYEKLEQRVAERTADLLAANAKLQDEVFERMQTERRVWQMAHHDALTGLPNRALLQDRLDQALAQATRYSHQVGVMFIDLDRFKGINDTLGHAVGDELLKEVAERLKTVVRAVDTVARLGGDEFVVVLHEVSGPDDAVLVAEKIIVSLGQTVIVDGHELHVTPSIGVSIFPHDGTNSVQLMKNADTAMYHSKSAGRNTYRFFATEMNDEASRFFKLEHRLITALERGELVLHYQPLVDLDRRAVCGMEALVRWLDPERGLIDPGEFIPVAEETGLILTVGEWVMHQAMRQNRLWQEQGYPLMPISVNLSPRQFQQRSLVKIIRDILADTGQPPYLLELEITEGTLMQDVSETLEKLNELAAMGIKLAIDDFGTGYSSLSYLKRFPVHKLKVDQSFVRDLCDDKEDAAIVAAIIGLARNLEIDILAEGVENEQQLTMLTNFGCRKFQGYYFSRPLTHDKSALLFRPPRLGAQDSLF
jgi:diguanylate cyclase (GGDEF)-like protein/PAS domain S-box-containing protein